MDSRKLLMMALGNEVAQVLRALEGRFSVEKYHNKVFRVPASLEYLKLVYCTTTGADTGFYCTMNPSSLD